MLAMSIYRCVANRLEGSPIPPWDLLSFTSVCVNPAIHGAVAQRCVCSDVDALLLMRRQG